MTGCVFDGRRTGDGRWNGSPHKKRPRRRSAADGRAAGAAPVTLLAAVGATQGQAGAVGGR